MLKIRRDKLMRLAQAGKLVMVSSYHYDEMTGQEITKKEIPVRISKEYGDFIEGQCNLRESDFTSHVGYTSLSDDAMTCTLGVNGNCWYELRMANHQPFPIPNGKARKAKLPHNQRMQDFLKTNGIDATPAYMDAGSLRGTWRLYNGAVKWTEELRQKLTELGFLDFDSKPLGPYSGNGGVFSVFVRGHSEFLNG